MQPKPADSVLASDAKGILAADLSISGTEFTLQAGQGDAFPASDFSVEINGETIDVGTRTTDTFSSLTRANPVPHNGGARGEAVYHVTSGAAIADAVTAGGGGSSALEYIVTDYTIADMVDVGGYAAIGPVATISPGDVILGAVLEITEIWDGIGLGLQLVSDPSSNDFNQSYTLALDGSTVTEPANGLVDFRTSSAVNGSGNSHDLIGWLPSTAPSVPMYAASGVNFGDQGATGALIMRLIVLRAP